MTISEQVLQAIARGWCHEKNSHKEMDSDLAKAICEEVLSMGLTKSYLGSLDFACAEAYRCGHEAGVKEGILEGIGRASQVRESGKSEADIKAVLGLQRAAALCRANKQGLAEMIIDDDIDEIVSQKLDYKLGQIEAFKRAVEMKKTVRLTALPSSVAACQWTDAMAAAYSLACSDYASAIESELKKLEV
jgi:hypothetical protein